MPVPYTFGTATAAIPLSQLDSNFATAITLGNTAVYLGNTTTSLGNVTLTNVTISSGNATVSNITANAVTSPAATNLLLQSAGTTAVTIDTSQNVGIGTVLPTTKLQVAGTTKIGVTGTNGILSLARTSDGATITNFKTDGTSGIIDSAISTTFQINTVEAMRIDSSGNLLVAKTATSTTTAGAEIRSADGSFYSTIAATTNATSTYNAYSTGVSAYRFYVGMAGTVFATNIAITGISDVRLKENIRDLDDGLDVVIALKPRKFDWKEGKGAGIKNARGFIAQEFEQVLPDMIEEWKDPAPEGEEPYKAVNANLIPTLVKAIQEQQALIQSLTARITALETPAPTTLTGTQA